MVNTVMDTPSLDSFILGAEKLYNDNEYRKSLGFQGHKIATASRFKWENIATQFESVFQTVLQRKGS
jgi:glycosyltransferase involved in cell wall biosynthesis